MDTGQNPNAPPSQPSNKFSGFYILLFVFICVIAFSIFVFGGIYLSEKNRISNS